MNNVKIEIVENELVIRVDLTKDFGLSSSGKSMIVASSCGNKSIGKDNIKLGLNVYKPVNA